MVFWFTEFVKFDFWELFQDCAPKINPKNRNDWRVVWITTTVCLNQKNTVRETRAVCNDSSGKGSNFACLAVSAAQRNKVWLQLKTQQYMFSITPYVQTLPTACLGSSPPNSPANDATFFFTMAQVSGCKHEFLNKGSCLKKATVRTLRCIR